MSKVKFGTSQLNNPTPSSWATGIQIFTVIAGSLIAWIGTANFIPADTSSILQSILGLMLTIANGLKPFLGVETTQKNVPIEEVSEMEVTDDKADKH